MNTDDKTLVILTPAFPTNEADGHMPGLDSFVRSLNKNYPALRITILAFHFPVTNIATYNWHGNNVIAFSGGLKGKLNSVTLWIRVWKKLSALNTQKNIIGLLSFFCSESAFVGHYFSKFHHLKHYIWVLGQDAKKNNKQVSRIKPLAEELITISDFLVEEFEKNHSIRPEHVIPLGIDPDDFSTNIFERNIDLIGAGSLIPLKQYNLFVEVVDIVRHNIPSVKAVICGNGAEEQALRAQIRSAHLESTITMSGQKKDRREVLGLLQQSKILLHTSSYEGFGMVTIEALFAGAQVISFCKPMNDAIENWHIVKSTTEMAAKVIELLQKNNAGYKSVLPFSMNSTTTQIMLLYNYNEGSPNSLI